MPDIGAKLVACAIIPLIWSNAALPTHEPNPVAAYMSADDVRASVAASTPLVLVDVRAEDEFAAGHLPESINIPVTSLPDSAKTLPRDRRLVVYCIHSTHRAPVAAAALRELGFTDVSVVEGGLVALVEAGLKLESATAPGPPRILPFTDRCRDAKDAAPKPQR
jgi:rhodanese-related sulfurtransferase